MKELLEVLHEVFYKEPDFEDIIRDIETWRQQLIQTLDKAERKLLLGIIDAKDCIITETSVDSFIFGFRLALQLANELNYCEKENPLPTSQDIRRSAV